LEEKDPNQPDIEMDDVVEVLQEFHRIREERMNSQELIGNPSLKKKSNFQTEEQKVER
jgi:fructose-1,6-bisphosphatase